MKKLITICAVVALVLGFSGAAIAQPTIEERGGGPNGIHVGFEVGGISYDSYWLKTRSGVVHEWRFDEPTGLDVTKDVHYVFKPADKFDTADCDAENFLRSFAWTCNLTGYTDAAGDEGDLSDFLTHGDSYWVCVYEEIEEIE